MAASPSKYTHPRSEMLDFLPKEARTVLDVGAAEGHFGAALRERRPDIVLWGVEPSAEGHKTNAYDRFIVGQTLLEAAPELCMNSFDAIFFNDVLEHMAEPADALTLAEELLSEDGVVVASLPNVRHASALLPLLLHGRWDYTDIGVLDRTHLRFFTRRSAEQFFVTNGWTLRGVTGINRWYPKLRWLRVVDDFCYLQYVVVAAPARPDRFDAP